MNILFDISHPAHFHLFKNVINKLSSNHHSIMVTAREKDVLIDLLTRDYFHFHSLSKRHNGHIGLFIELVLRNVKMLNLCRAFKPDLLVGTSVNVAHIGKIIKKPTLIVNEDDDAVVPAFSYLAYPFATNILNPNCLLFSKWRRKRILHNSYHELAYLHPANFLPDESILEKYSLEAGKYVVARFSALIAHHDYGAKGLSSDLWSEIIKVLRDYEIVTSAENDCTRVILPWDMHHVLAFAKLVISDSQTMTAEAAVLGVPSIRCSSFVGRLSYLEELEQRYRLTFGFRPDQSVDMINKIIELINNDNLYLHWMEKRNIMLSEKSNFSDFIYDLITTYN